MTEAERTAMFDAIYIRQYWRRTDRWPKVHWPEDARRLNQTALRLTDFEEVGFLLDEIDRLTTHTPMQPNDKRE